MSKALILLIDSEGNPIAAVQDNTTTKKRIDTALTDHFDTEAEAEVSPEQLENLSFAEPFKFNAKVDEYRENISAFKLLIY